LDAEGSSAAYKGARLAMTDAEIERLALDAARYRWLRDDNAYAPEEAAIPGGEDLDELCDESIAFLARHKPSNEAD
jgi:hypothetical protein